MQDQPQVTLTPEGKLQKAQGSLNAFVLATLLYLKANSHSVEAFWDFVGDRLARGWDPKTTPIEFLRDEGAFLNAIGCDLRSISGDEARAEAVVAAWPPDGDWTAENFLAFFGLAQEDADTFWRSYGPIARRLGFDFEWQRHGRQVTLTVTRRPPSGKE